MPSSPLNMRIVINGVGGQVCADLVLVEGRACCDNCSLLITGIRDAAPIFGIFHVLQGDITLSECATRILRYAHLNRLQAISRELISMLAGLRIQERDPFSLRVSALVVNESLEWVQDLSTWIRCHWGQKCSRSDDINVSELTSAYWVAARRVFLSRWGSLYCVSSYISVFK